MSELKIHVAEGFDSLAARVAEAWHRAEGGEAVEPEAHVTFESWEGLARTLSGKRLDLLRHLHRNPAASIAELSRTLGRDYKRVHEDVEILTAAGLIERTGKGALVARYDQIRTTIAL